jgi:hypothetical protein
VESSGHRSLARKCSRPGAGNGGAGGDRLKGRLGDQAELAGLGDSLGAVGRAELAQQVADVLFTVSRVTTSCICSLAGSATPVSVFISVATGPSAGTPAVPG